MIYLTYRKKDGYVVSTHEQESQAEESFAVAKSDAFKVGDEFQYFITIMEVDENGVATKHASAQQAPPAQELLERLAVSEQRNEVLDQMLFETNTELLQTQIEKDAIGQELFSLQTELIQKECCN